ncbi:MAG: hypothetical protein HC903_14390 [Methylacidiphilales bacterium]|nr:hypothetical protein [Candidatus Methylacidiphilales bacterium]NJR19230.1 hypothetical protein [Calothrix sp. CSU_2_0]
MNSLAIQLTLHGAVIILIGLLCGIPYGSAITHKEDEKKINAWRLAHSSLAMGGTTIIAFSAVISNLKLEPILSNILVISSAVSGYAFAIALPYAAWVGYRGLTNEKPGINQVIYLGNLVGAIGSLVATLVLIIGCLNTLI